MDVEFDKRLKDEVDFHGDKNEILTGYIREAYLLKNINMLELFAGRVSRNFGIPNEYSLIFSNNPYSFDHYGFSLIGNKTNYSFYFSRLNDYDNSIDSQGELIPIDSVMTTKRYFSFQHLDLKVSSKMQIALSQSIIYGGPYQSLEGVFLNPINFYYADQRNSNIAMNGFWQFLLSYQTSPKTMFYLDFLIDDIILNNDQDNERENNPDRIGVTFKFSLIDCFFIKSLMSLSYTKISNNTYTTYKNFENYFYQLKGIGFPVNSFESIQYSLALFPKTNLIYLFKIDFSQKGNSGIFDVFDSNKEDFPILPALYTINLSSSVSCKILNKARVFYEISNKLQRYSNLDNYEKNNFNHELRVVYEI